MHRGEHEQRRDRREVLVGVAVAEHDELGAVLDRVIDFLAHLREALLHALVAGLDAVQAADRDRRAAGQGGVDVLDLRELVVVDHREVERDVLRVVWAPRQEVALRAEAERQRRDDFFTDRVERRVRHLRELLREVVEQQPGTLAEHRDRGVAAHRTERLSAVLAHRGEQDAHLLLGVAERALTARDRGDRVHDVLALRKVGEAHAPGVEPLLPGLERRELGLDLVVFDDALLCRVDEEHATGAKASAALDALGLEVEHAGLAADDDQAVGGLGPAAGAQPVAVERRADDGAVGEDERRRSVPGLHLHRVVVVERAQVAVDVDLLLVGLRHHHHDRVRQAASREGEQLQHLVERRRVARALRADRKERTDVAQQLRLQLGLPRAHPVAVAVDGVDLAVVGEHAQRLGERPGREGVGRVPGVHDRELRGEPLIGQVGVERLELERRDHALVAERAAGQRHEVRAELAARALAQPVDAAVQSDARQSGLGAEARARDEQLLEDRACGEGELAEVGLVDRHRAPAEDDQVLARRDLRDTRLERSALFGVVRQEGHARGVLADRRKIEVHDRAEEGIRHLRQDAGAVAGTRVRPDRTAVLEVAQGCQRQGDDVMSGLATKCRDHGQAAGVLFERGVVHPLLRGEGAKVRWTGAAVGARKHTYRPHIDAQDGTTSARLLVTLRRVCLWRCPR